MISFRRRLDLVGPLSLVPLTILATAIAPQAVRAQTATLEEVIVVAQKREENMMDVPVALTAVSERDLNVYGVRDTTDLTKLSPSLSYDQTELSQNSGFRIRGIGTVVYSTTAEAAVSVVIDDVATSQSGQALANLSDIERVEILRGPQSTLFGRNASAGVINIVTKGPTLEFEAGSELTLTDDNQEKISAWVSGPLSETVGYRVSGYYDDLDGWVENLNPAGDTNGSTTWGINSSLEWQANDTLGLKFQARYDDSKSECCSGSIKFLEDPETAAVLVFIPLTDAAPEIIPFVGDDNTTITVDDLVDVESENLQLSLRAEWDIGEHSLISITAYNEYTLDEFNELDNTSFPVLDYPFGAGTIADPTGSGADTFTIASNRGVVQFNQLEVDFYSQEFRLLSPAADWGNYIAGMYYSRMEDGRRFDRYVPGLGVAAGLDGHSEDENESSAISIFGQTTLNLGERSRFTVGARYQYEEIEVKQTEIDFYGGSPDVSASYDDDDTIFMGNLAFQYDVGETGMLFARYARGHKGQFFDAAAASFFDGDLVPVKPEKSDAFEIGYKAQLMDNRMRVEVVGFYTIYEDYQAQQQTVDEAGAIEFSTANVGELENYGLEIDTTWLIGNNFTLQAAAAWIDATISEYDDAECYFGQTESQGCVQDEDGVFRQDLAGEDLQNSPDLKFNIAGTYYWPQSSSSWLPGDVFVNAAYVWTDEVNFDLQLAPWMEADSYDIVNVSAGLEVEGDISYSISIFANNLFDDDYDNALLDLADSARQPATTRFVPRDFSTYYGIRLRVDL
ncbi:MAG: TonB-dependent receptor [Pseudomonadota bacterium]